jgi:phosphoribosylformylglycinamidine (FGAM) synthase-like amidotransferase family enzyme
MLWGVLQFPGSCDERDALHACGLNGEARLIWHEEQELGGMFAGGGGRVLGICNGFQVLCEADLLPGALLLNESMRFVCRQVDLVADGPKADDMRPDSAHRRLSIPAKHGEGRYWAPEEVLDRIEANGQVAFRYAPGQNPNGSARDIAGVRNAAGNVLGLMPHPEHAVDAMTGSTDGLRVFEEVAGTAA